MTTDSRLMRWATGIADLDNPFLTEERQRAVVYEASTVGLNVAVWTSMVVVAVAFWVGGQAGWRYSAGTFAVLWTGTSVTWWYAYRHDVVIPFFPSSSRPRPAKIADIVVGMAALTGMLRAVWQEDVALFILMTVPLVVSASTVAIVRWRSNKSMPDRGHDKEDDQGQ
jgi:hypothetical protein